MSFGGVVTAYLSSVTGDIFEVCYNCSNVVDNSLLTRVFLYVNVDHYVNGPLIRKICFKAEKYSTKNVFSFLCRLVRDHSEKYIFDRRT